MNALIFMLRIVCVTGQYTDCSSTCRLNEESGESEHFDWQQQAAERGQESVRAASHGARGKGMAVHITQQYTYIVHVTQQYTDMYM